MTKCKTTCPYLSKTVTVGFGIHTFFRCEAWKYNVNMDATPERCCHCIRGEQPATTLDIITERTQRQKPVLLRTSKPKKNEKTINRHINWEQAFHLREMGFSLREISDRLDTAPSTLCRRFRANGLKWNK